MEIKIFGLQLHSKVIYIYTKENKKETTKIGLG